MPGFLGGSSGSGTGGEILFPAEFIDPVTKLRVSEPETLIDTDFEYGLQPTKWETVELINNTPSFFSKSGDTTINGILAMVTTATSREIKVTTQDNHNLAVGIPINVSGSKSITADGSYIINSIPDPKTFTYLAKQDQDFTASIFDLYTSIITGEFFQGSQIKISDSQGIVTNAASPSVLTVQTDSPHGFQVGTPFYFLNLNSTVSQQFDASNTGAKTFDSSNSATAQTFDGSNTLTSYSLDLQNKATIGGTTSASQVHSAANKTVTVLHTVENFQGKPIGTPLYYNVIANSGDFNTTPRGIVYIADNGFNSLGASTSTFSVALTPGGTAIDIPTFPNGTFQLANNVSFFAGNNNDAATQTTVNVFEQAAKIFDGANNLGSLSTVNTYSGTIIQLNNDAGTSISSGLSVGAMVLYTSTSAAASGLSNNSTYFVTYYNEPAGASVPGFFQIKVAALPGGTDITVSGGTGTQKFRKIGISTDKDIIHIPNHAYAVGDMVKYTFPAGNPAAMASRVSEYLYVENVYDGNNLALSLLPGMQVSSTGTVTNTSEAGVAYKTHTFLASALTSANHSVTFTGNGTIDFLMVGGGGGGGGQVGGGGGAGGMVVASNYAVTAGTYAIVVGGGGVGSRLCCSPYTPEPGDYGKNTTFLGITARGGGGGGCHPSAARPVSGNDGIGGGFGRPGGSGGGGGGDDQSVPRPGGSSNQVTSGAGWVGYGGSGGQAYVGWAGGGGGGANGNGANATSNESTGQVGGDGRANSFRTGFNQFYAAGGNGGNSQTNVYVGARPSGIGGRGTGFNSGSWDEKHAVADTGSGGGGTRDGIPAGDGAAGIVVIRFRG